jgi:glyoxylase I family protein
MPVFVCQGGVCYLVLIKFQDIALGFLFCLYWIKTSRELRMRIEHIAINVEDPVAMARWYCENLSMKIVRQGPSPANTHFLSDTGDNVLLEIYHNPPDAVPDYASMDPLLFHIAFLADDIREICRKLVSAGATIVSDLSTTPSGDEFAILRDPWGISIQVIKRAEPMLAGD